MYGLGADDLTQVMGIGFLGEVRQGPDGNLYEWVQGVDGLGNPFGFWRRFRRLVRRALPLAQKYASFIPGYGPAIAAGIKAATPLLRQAGVAGYAGLGALYQAPDGSLYQVSGYSGLAGDEELAGLGALYQAPDGSLYQMSGYAGDEELAGDEALDGLGALYQAPDGSLYQMPGYAGDEELAGLEADDELGYFSEADELSGYAGDEELSGLEADDDLGYLSQDDDLRGYGGGEELDGFTGDEELTGFTGDEELAGYGESDELGDMDGYIFDPRMSGLEAYVPDRPAGTRPFAALTPETWKAIW